MPRNANVVRRLEQLSEHERIGAGLYAQTHWYNFFSKFVKDKSVIDIGAGNGYGMHLMLDAGAAYVDGIDPLPMCTCVRKGYASDIDRKYNIAIALDVIEHVDDDKLFFDKLCSIAIDMVIIATPNYNYTKCANGYHFFEYSPEEILALVGKRKCEWFTSDSALNITSIASPHDAKDNFGVIVYA